MTEATLRKLLRVAPFGFGVGFLAPVIVQAGAALGVGDPFSRLTVGLTVGGLWGLAAMIRGRCI